MKNRYIAFVLFIFTAIIFLLLTADMSPLRKDIISQKISSKDKIQLTVCVNDKIDLKSVELFAEENLKNLDLVLISSFAQDSQSEEELRFLHDDLGDIVITKNIDAKSKSGNGRLMDISKTSVVSKYEKQSLKSLYQGESLYYLPAPGDITTIIYNKTFFEENGWREPKSFTRFVELCRDIKKFGIKPLQLSEKNKDNIADIFVEMIFSHAGEDKFLSEDIEKYKNGEGNFYDISQSVRKDFGVLLRANAINFSDINTSLSSGLQSFFNRKSAMIIGGLDIIAAAKEQVLTDEFSIVPFYTTANNDGWQSLSPNMYIALNKHLENAPKEKYDLALSLLELLSSKKGQQILSSENHNFISPVSNANPLWGENVNFQTDSLNFLIAQSVFSKNAYNELYNSFANISSDGSNVELLFEQVDVVNKLPSNKTQSQLLGKADRTFSIAQTGSYIADTVRIALGTQFVLFLDSGKDGNYNGKGVTAKIYEGDIYENDIVNRVFPSLDEKSGTVDVITVTGENLKNILEYSIDGGDWFYYFSGMKVTINPYAEKGKRIKKLTDRYGDELIADKIYVVTILNGTVDEKYIISCDNYPMKFIDYVIKDIKEKGKISPPNDRRLRIVTN